MPRGNSRAEYSFPSCLRVIHDLFLIEFRLADFAVFEDVRHLQHVAVLRLDDHFESDLESYRVEAHALERIATHQKITAGDILDSRKRTREPARDPRRDDAAARPVGDAAPRHVAAADCKTVPSGRERFDHFRQRVHVVAKIRIHGS